MPIYCYRCQSTNEVIEEVYPSSKIPRRIHREGKAYVRDIAAEHGEGQHRPIGYYESNAMGVHPDQIPEAMADARSKGVKIDFTPDGTAYWKGVDARQRRKEYCRAYGFHDRDGGYGDP